MLKVSYIGFNEYLARIKAAPAKLQKEVDAEVNKAADMFRDTAKRDLASQGGDRGTLMKSIAVVKEDTLKYRVSANVFYAPYVEFGTKKKVSITPGFEDVAASAKGLPKRGDYYDFLNSILDWVKRKGLHNIKNSYTGKNVGGKAAKENLVVLAEAIAWSIMKNGIAPKPFFFKQFAPTRTLLTTKLKNLLKSGI